LPVGPRRDFPAYQIDKRIHAPIKFNSTNIKCFGSTYILVLIADKEAGVTIDWPFICRLLEQTGCGLATLAMYRQRLDRSLGMVRAKIKCINMGPMRCEFLLHMRMEGFHCFFRVVSARNTRLVGDHQNVISGLVQKPHGLRGAIDPFELLRSVGIAAVDIEDAIAIEKCRRPARVNSLLMYAAAVFLLGHLRNGLGMLNRPVQAADWASSGRGARLISTWQAVRTETSHA